MFMKIPVGSTFDPVIPRTQFGIDLFKILAKTANLHSVDDVDSSAACFFASSYLTNCFPSLSLINSKRQTRL